MRQTLLITAAFLFTFATGAWSQEHSGQGQNQPANTAQAPDQAQHQAASQVPHEPAPAVVSARGTAQGESQPVDPVAEAARKAREAQKENAKPARVFTNDDLASAGPISVVGPSSPTASSAANASANAAPAGEKEWRKKFADLHDQLNRDQEDLDVMQRELGVLSVQYYNDPLKAMKQQYSRSDINDKTAAIEKKKQAVAADQQAISDAQDQLQKSGGDPGWAR